ncbi:hypothetical protein DFQ28_008614 [Apophysomyces sp. BC1034]|nr:hypothetical protein DFQ30_008358 [Apophysomyces sp. BC1015]KAG0174857.1 hypothetical protein DFQ29_007334 [Apophysomyces sp. BC1021]KAG0185903.1 hypothetical protein DFQ28_008614 [Apophysomyces sp. BC1034]
MATTGVTNTGLNAINMSDLSNWQLTLLMLNSFFCSHIIISFFIVLVRRYYFSKRFEDILLYNKAMQLREEHRRRKKVDIETGEKVENFFSTRPIRRRLSFMSTRSTPVEGNDRQLRSRRQSFDTHATRTNDIYGLITQFREYQQTMQDKREQAEKQQQQLEALELEKQLSNPGHPCDVAGKPIGCDNNDLRRVTTATSVSGTTDGNTASGQGIAFAGNIERQREMARQRLERSRRFEELLQKIANETAGDDETAALPDNEDEDEDYENIMRLPIEKSQLTREQRYRIGGAEYRALDLLARIVASYYLGFIVGCGIIYRIYVAVSPFCQEVLATSNPGPPTNPWLFSFFLSVSAMNNLGMSVLDASMTPFQNTPFPLIVAIILILVGNTAFAIVLRFIIWSLYKLTPKSRVMRRESFRYLLDHPRRCFTTLFPATKTWWLLIVLILITLVEVVAFLSLNYWLPVLSGLPWPSRVLDGIFQSVATRNAGFSVVGLADINPGTQLVYIVAMYISVYPVAISMRNSNVYQERSLGIFRGQDEEPVRFSEQELNGPAPFIKLRRHPTISSVVTTSKRMLRGPDFFVITQIQRQLTSDICWVIVGIFLISIIEAEEIMSPSAITMSTVIYECVSAFANVGASTGFPGTSTSQAGAYRTLSKLVLIALMYRGRHRGLPAAIDRAVLLPSEQLEQREEEDNILRRRNTSVSQMNGPTVMFYNRSSTL